MERRSIISLFIGIVFPFCICGCYDCYLVGKMDTPQNVKIVDGSVSMHQFRVSWDQVLGAESYSLNVCSESNEYVTSDETVNTYLDFTEMDAGKTFRITVRAYNQFYTTSDKSEEVTVTTEKDENCTLSTPVQTKAEYNSEKHVASLSWNAVAGASYYSIYKYASGTDSTSRNYYYYDSTTELSYDDAMVFPDTTYLYKVKAYSTKEGMPVYSEPASFSRIDVGEAKEKSIDTAVTVATGSVYYSSLGGSDSLWIKVTAPESGKLTLSFTGVSVYTGFTVQYRVWKEKSFTTPVATGADLSGTAITIQNLAPSGTYYIQLDTGGTAETNLQNQLFAMKVGVCI